MSFFEFPNTRTYDSDLGWLIKNFGLLDDQVETLATWAGTHRKEYSELANKVDGLINNLIDVIVPWDSSVAYRVFSIVEYQGTNYIAVKDVPVGTMITNTEYWQPASTIVEQINAIGIEVSELMRKVKPTLHVFPDLSSDETYSSNCSLIYSGDKTFLMDAGALRNWTAINNMLDEEIASGRLTNIDYIIISHYHWDHIECLDNILTKVQHYNCTAYIPANPTPYGYDYSSAYATVIQTLENSNVNTVIVSSDLDINYDDNRVFHLYNATAGDWAYYQGEESPYNDLSMVTLFDDDGVYNIYPADLETKGQTRVENQHNLPKCQLMLAPHHGIGSGNNYSLSFKTATSPDVLPITTSSVKLAGINTSYGGATPYADNAELVSSAYGAMKIVTSQYGHYVVEGHRPDSIGTSLVTTDFYVDGNQPTNGNGTEDDPFNSIFAALNNISNKRNNYYNIHVKALTSGSYPVMYIRNMHNPINISRWGTDEVFINFAYIGHCMEVQLSNLTFIGGAVRSNIYQCAVVTASEYALFNNCKFIDQNNTDNVQASLVRVEQNGSVRLSNCVFEKASTAIVAGVTALNGGHVYSAGNNNFVNVNRGYHISGMELIISGNDDTLTGSGVYIYGSGNYTVLSVLNNAMIALLGTITSGNAISNIFNYGNNHCVMIGGTRYILTLETA